MSVPFLFLCAIGLAANSAFASPIRQGQIHQKRYSSSTAASITIPFYGSNGDFDFVDDPRVTYKLNPDDDEQHTFHPMVDTGSTGILLGAGNYPDYDLQKDWIATFPAGHSYLSSSQYLYTGYWVDSTIHFQDAPVTAQVAILVVTQLVTCTDYDNSNPSYCPPEATTLTCTGTDCTSSYFGVGFGREHDGQSQNTPDKNALLNINSINNMPVPSNYTVGYAVTEAGITVGLTEENTDGYTMIKLTQNTQFPSSESQYDWLPVEGCLQVTVPGSSATSPCVSSSFLLDTGIDHSYVTLTDAAGLSGWTWSKTSQSDYQYIGDGYQFTLNFGSDPYPATYSFVSGTVDGVTDPLAPTQILAHLNETAGADAYINPGRYFYKVNNIVFDATNGYWGVQARSASS
ncbi:putative outer membrane autotransporter barrel protein [Phaeomoniella chlamydospora]|uniref:Putative outer membrane autotransporter barrel protein n=1 Tax=Phaeomoniella chlamydospora TaxID=158046 RepID=A0A0G2E295_PHACM|nr:putative outer membrane autotransporter barrel protein [Phaeomoniella chlamydospora]